MLLRRLTPSGSSFLPSHSHPTICRAAIRCARVVSSYLPQFPTPHPWCSVRGFSPWASHLPRLLPAGHLVSGRPLHLRITDSGGWCSFYTSASVMMERPDREPPHKRRKSAEEKRSMDEWRGQRGGAAGATRGKNEDPNHPKPNRFNKDRSRDRGHSAVRKGSSHEISGDNEEGQTRTDKPQKEGAASDGTTNRGWTTCRKGKSKDSQPWRTQSHQSEPEQVPLHEHESLSKGRSAEEQGGCRGLLYKHPTSPPKPWQAAEADWEPSPPGTSPPPVRQQEDTQPAKPLQRHWEVPTCSTDVQPEEGSTVFDFSVMSYNILSQDLLQDNAYLYRHCYPAVLPWNHRLPNLLAEIQQHDADILCLQEVQEDHYENQIKPALQALGYQCEYKKRTGKKPDGCAVVFKSSRLSLISSNPVEFFRPGDALLDRDNVGLVVLLQPNDTASESDPTSSICVANTHLLYNPRRGDIKLAQLAILLAEIGRMSRLPGGSTGPVVLCGDFNSTPWSPLYSFLTSGCLDYRGLQIGSVSGQENSPRGQRLLPFPIWSHSLGIDHQCQYRNKSAESSTSSPTVEGEISNLTVEDLTTKAAAAFNRLRIEHALKLQSSYEHFLPPDGRPEITTCHSRTAMTVDYILYTPDFITLPAGQGLRLLGRLSLVGQSELEEVNGLPNRHHSSDHLPLLTRFRLRR